MRIGTCHYFPFGIHGNISLGQDSDLSHGVNIYTDEILGGDIAVGLDVDTDLLQDQFILFLQERDLDAGTSDQDLGLSLDTGDDVGFVR